jgi:hypothetical protein
MVDVAVCREDAMADVYFPPPFGVGSGVDSERL